MEIDGGGFLGRPLPDVRQTAPGANQALFEVLLKLCAFAETLKAELVVARQGTDEEKQKVIAAIVFVRLLEIVQAVAILAAHGVREELHSLFRVFLDAYFVLANCCTSADFIPTYFHTDLPTRLKLLNAAAKHDSPLFALAKEYATAEVKNELDAKIKAEKIDAFNSQLFAHNVGCDAIYDSMYRLASASVHTTPRCLEHYVEEDAQGEIVKVLHRSDATTTDRVTYDISWFFIKSLHGICELFGIHRDAELDSLESTLNTVVPEPTLRPT
ncbi:MAG: DUF5677 domain-containing protein [Terriglobales bacterium]